MTASTHKLSAIAGVSALLAVAAITATVVGLLLSSDRRVADVPSQPQPQQIDPALQLYRQAAELAVALEEPRALALLDEQRVVVAGDQVLLIYRRDGTVLKRIALSEPPQCVAAGSSHHLYPQRIYVGFRNHVKVFDTAGDLIAVWQPPRDNADLLSIAVAQRDVFVADISNRLVWRYDTEGRLLGSFGTPVKSRGYPGFVITTRYFDVAASNDGLLYAVNPRLLRIEGFDYTNPEQQVPVRHWGRGSPQLDGFFGCCNPIHIAVFADGRFATAEKGFPWVKIFSRQGEFEGVVAGPAELAAPAADLTVDEDNNVLVLDAAAKRVRIFAPKNSQDVSDSDKRQ